MGTEALLQGVVDYVSNPGEMEGIDPAGPTLGFVFKTCLLYTSAIKSIKFCKFKNWVFQYS